MSFKEGALTEAEVVQLGHPRTLHRRIDGFTNGTFCTLASRVDGPGSVVRAARRHPLRSGNNPPLGPNYSGRLSSIVEEPPPFANLPNPVPWVRPKQGEAGLSHPVSIQVPCPDHAIPLGVRDHVAPGPVHPTGWESKPGISVP